MRAPQRVERVPARLGLGEPMQGVVGWFAGFGEIPLAPPPRLREYAPLDDDPDGHGNFTDEKICGVAFAMEYCDGRGWASTRTVRCLASDPTHPARIRAFCHVRQAERTFRADRIISIADLRTGQILSGDAHANLLAPYLGQEDEPDRHMTALLEAQDVARDGVFALLQLAMPAGRLGYTARMAVIQYIRQEVEAHGRKPPFGGHLELWVDNLAPPLELVLGSVRNLLQDREKFARVLPFALKVLRARGRTAEGEEALRELIAVVREHFRHQPIEWSRDLRATP